MATELVAIELELRGEEEVYRDLQKLDSMLQGFSGPKGKKTIELDMKQSQQRLIELRSEINKTKDELGELAKKAADANNKLRNTKANPAGKYYKNLKKQADEATAAFEKQEAHLKKIQSEYRDVTTRVNELRYALKNFQQASWGQMFSKVSTGLKHVGQNAQTLGNVLTRLGSPFRRITTGVLYGAGYKALNLMTEGLSNSFARYDTMRKYEQIMASYEKANYSAKKSKEELDNAVQGLPTGLDEIMSVAQRFTATSGDIEKGTKLAIAANNAFLASMSTETQQYQGMMQLQDVIGGKKMNAREWQALANSMMPAIRKIGESLGYQGKELDDYVASVQQGKIANEDFLDALIKAGYGVDSKLGQIAEISKQTWQALASNTRIAFARMGEAVLTELDEVSKKYNGKTLIQNLLQEKGVIDQWKNSIVGWIKANPDKIISFFQSLKQIDFAGFGRGIVDGMKTLAESVKWLTDTFGGTGGMRKIGWFMTIAGPLGRAITTFGGVLKGLSHPLAAIFATIAKGTMMTVGEVKKGGGLMGAIGRLLVGSGKAGEATEAMKEAGEAATEAGKVAPKMGKFSSALSGFFKGWAEVAVMVGGSAFVGWASVKLIKGAMRDIKEIGNIVSDIDWGSATTGLLLAGDFIVALIGVGKLIGSNPELMKDLGIGTLVTGLVTLFASGTFMADMKMVKSGFKAISDSADYLAKTVDTLNGLDSIGNVGGVKTKVQNAITTLNQIKGLFKGSWDPVHGQWEGGLDKFPKSIRKSVENIAATITNMTTAVDSLNSLGKKKIDPKAIENVAEPLKDALSSLRSVILQIPSEWKESGVVDATTNLSSSLANLNKSFDAIGGKGGILSRIPAIVGQMEGLGRGGTLSRLQGKMKDLGTALKGAYDALNSGIGNGAYMATNLDNFRQALKSAKFALRHLVQLGGITVDDSVVANIKESFAKVKEAFDQGDISEIADTVNAFRKSIKDAFDSFEDLNQDIEINPKVKLGSGFNSSVNSVVRKINKAKSRIRSAVNSLPTDLYHDISVHINVKPIVTGIGAVKQIAEDTAKSFTATGGRVSRGGVLYRSGGGSVFKPRGTDKIPAMLTEGEYVHKKQAVDFFGTDFMQKVNAMDVRGAMNALLTKAGNATNIGRQSIINNTINNNQRVTQNINTNNASFAKVQMGRFAGAL